MITSTRGPFGIRIQSSSPALGCLFTIVGFVFAMTVALFGLFVALVMPVMMLIVGWRDESWVNLRRFG